MTVRGCPEIDDAGTYVLGAMPDDEAEGYVRHLDACDHCQAKVADLRMVADVLPRAVTQLQAPGVVKSRVMAIVRAESELLLAAGHGADRAPAPARRRGLLSLRPLPAMALAAVLLVLGVGTGTLLLNEDPAPAPHSISASVDRQAAPGARAQLRLGAEGAKLVVAGMPAPAKGRIYQVWLDRAGDRQPPRPTPVLFSVNHRGRASVDVPGDLHGVASVLVTSEPLGGSEIPSRLPVISVHPA